MTNDEAARLRSLQRLLVLDTEPEPLFDTIASSAAALCGTPIALITLVDADRQWFKARHGALAVAQTPREVSFCSHAIEGAERLDVADARLDRRFADNPLVVGPLQVRFYSGVPLVLADGQRVGALCVIDHRPRQLDDAQSAQLGALATMATQALEMRRDLIAKTFEAQARYEAALARSEAIHRSMIQHQTDLVSLSDEQGTLLYVNDAYARHFNREGLVGTNLYQGVDEAHVDDVKAHMADVFANGHVQKRDFLTQDADGRARWVEWTHSLHRVQDEPPMLLSVGRDVTERRRLEQALIDKEQFLRFITDNLPMQVAYVDTDRRFRFANTPHCVRMGFTREEMLGRTRSELTDAADDREVQPRLTLALAGSTQDFEFEVPLLGGTVGRMQTRLTPDRDEHGRVRGVICTALDVTARDASERLVRELMAIFENTTDFVTQSDADGTLRYVNPAARRLAGMTLDEPLDGRPYSAFNTSFSIERFETEMMPAIEKSGLWVGRSIVRGLPVSHMVICHRDDQGRIARVSTLMRDISEEVRLQEEQLRQATILRSIAESIPAAVAVVGPDARYRFANRSFNGQVPFDGLPVEGRTMVEVLGEEPWSGIRTHVERALAGELVVFEKAPAQRTRHQHLSISYVPLRPAGGAPDGFVTIVQDITRQKHEENRLKHLSQRDPLTGLLNRTGLEMYLQQGLYEPTQDKARLGLLYIDLDRFKPVNDTYGHPVGDELLRQFAERLTGLVRPTDAVVRHGGDEFAVVLQNVRDLAGLSHVASKVVAMSSMPFEVGPHHLTIGASVGYALGMDDHGGWPDLMRRADTMLYQAKAGGRGRGMGETC